MFLTNLFKYAQYWRKAYCVSQWIMMDANKHLKNSNAACFYTTIVLKLLIVVQMW